MEPDARGRQCFLYLRDPRSSRLPPSESTTHASVGHHVKDKAVLCKIAQRLKDLRVEAGAIDAIGCDE